MWTQFVSPAPTRLVALHFNSQNFRLTDSLKRSIELHVGIVGSSLPTLKPLCKSLLPRITDGNASSDPINDPAIPLARNHDGTSIRMTSLSQYPPNRLILDEDYNPTSRLRSGAAPICEYKVEVSALKLSKSHQHRLGSDGEYIDKTNDSDAGRHAPRPGIMRTTDVYVQMDTTQGESGRTDNDMTDEIKPANSRQQRPD